MYVYNCERSEHFEASYRQRGPYYRHLQSRTRVSHDGRTSHVML